MPVLIDFNNYPELNKYDVFAENTITNIGETIINNGYWYASNSEGVLLTSGNPPSGINETEIIVTTASNQLDNLIIDLTNVTYNLNNSTTLTNNQDQTFKPSINYNGNNIKYENNNKLIFDGENDENSQFFITDNGDNGISLKDITIELIRGAKASNIFWISDPNTGPGGITIINSNSNFYGNIINTETNDLTSSIIIQLDNNKIYGSIYSKTNILFSSDNVNIYPREYNINVLNSQNDPVVCYAKGTLILTKRGFVPIENIKAGNMVVTKGKIFKNKFINKNAKLEISPVIWISKFKVNKLNSVSRPIVIKKNALALNFPFKDLYVSPNHALLINGKMCIAKNIINGITIYQDNECDSVEYYHLECKKHSAIIANGVLSESYLHANNRFVFENSNTLHNRPKKINK